MVCVLYWLFALSDNFLQERKKKRLSPALEKKKGRREEKVTSSNFQLATSIYFKKNTSEILSKESALCVVYGGLARPLRKQLIIRGTLRLKN